jgi:predicted ferric reductase
MALTRTDVGAGVRHVLVAAAATAGVDAWIAGSGHAERMGSGVALLSATGVTALLWSYAGLVLGLAVGMRLPRRLLVLRRPSLAWHRRINLTVVGLMLAHITAFALLTPGGSWLVALVPQQAPIDALAYTVGVLSLYGAILLGPSYYLRRRLGPRVWLVAHQFAALVYALALWHALALGPDVRADGPWRSLLWIAQAPLIVLLALRLRRPRRVSDRVDVRLHHPHYAAARYAVLRNAATAGVILAGFIILTVALSAINPGLHATGR